MHLKNHCSTGWTVPLTSGLDTTGHQLNFIGIVLSKPKPWKPLIQSWLSFVFLINYELISWWIVTNILIESGVALSWHSSPEGSENVGHMWWRKSVHIHPMEMLWSREIMATHSMTGKSSNAHKDKVPKPCLDPVKVKALCGKLFTKN